MNIIKKAVFFLGCLLVTGMAQAIDFRLPGSIEPTRAPQSLPIQAAQQARTTVPIAAPTAEAESLGPEAEAIQFHLTDIILEGNTIYSNAQLRPLYQNKLNSTISIGKLIGIVQSITNYYRNNGYILSRAILPPQRIVGGVVHIRILEGFIDKVTVTGKPRGARALLQAYGKNIAANRPLRIKSMERYMQLANAIPGVSAKAVLEPSKTSTGASDLALAAEMKPVSGFISFDNFGTRYIGPTQLTGDIEGDSLFRSGDKTQMVVAGTPQMKSRIHYPYPPVSGQIDSNQAGQLLYFDASHDTPLGSDGMRFIFDGNYSETRPGFVLAPLNIIGRSNTFTSTVKYPVYLSRSQNFTVLGSFVYLDSGVRSQGVQLYLDHIRKVNATGNYDFSDGLLGNNSLGASVTQGLDVLGATPTQEVDVSRIKGRSVFTKFNGQLSRLQQLPWRFSAFVLMQGQYSVTPLLASEQFGFGGPQVGRGYDPSEIIGDQGLSGSAELRYSVGPNRKLLQAIQLYAFYDAGEIWNRKTIGLPFKQSGVSTGGGIRMFFTNNFSGNFYVAKPMTKPAAAENIDHNGLAPRYYFSMTATG